MNKELLYRFFKGKTSYNEEKQIRSWMKESDENYSSFLRERKIYDTILLTDINASMQRKRYAKLSPWITGIAAAVILVLLLGGIYMYVLSAKNEHYNTILVPPGQRINLILSDNTNLWLNANTTFSYPTEFSKDKRIVYLDGEAYFEVSKNEKKPFIVKTDQGDIHVTGTSFNLEAYSKYKSFEASLFEGGIDIYREKIMLSSLSPNEKGVFENNKLLISKINNTDKYLWRNGLISFNENSLEEILCTLEKYFDVNIQIKTANLSKHTYTGKFRQSDGVEYALRVLQKSIQFTYERDEDTRIIYIK